MNVERFINARKALGMSQAELCEGICTQATLSKFESSGRAPAVRILVQLCARLGLKLDDVFPINQPAELEVHHILDTAEFKLITSEYESALADLDGISFDHLSDEGKMQYFFIKGYLTALTDEPISDSLYYFNMILNDLDNEHRTIYSQLAYTGSGVAYSRNNENEKAEFYFQKVFDDLQKLLLNSNKAIWRALNMIYYTAEYYNRIGDYKTSDGLLNYGYDVCSDKRVTYYIAKICFLRAQNLKARNGDEAQIIEELNDAKAFSRLNHNYKLIEKIESFEEQSV